MSVIDCVRSSIALGAVVSSLSPAFLSSRVRFLTSREISLHHSSLTLIPVSSRDVIASLERSSGLSESTDVMSLSFVVRSSRTNFSVFTRVPPYLVLKNSLFTCSSRSRLKYGSWVLVFFLGSSSGSLLMSSYIWLFCSLLVLFFWFVIFYF